MGLVDLSRSKAKAARSLRWFVGKKRTEVGYSSRAQDPRSEPSSREDLPETSSLWDRAYDSLRSSDSTLVDDYEKFFVEEAGKDGLPDDISGSADGRSRQARLEAVIAAGLRRIEEKKMRYTVAGHEFNLSDQIDQAARLVLWARDWIGEAVKRSPEASIVWAGISVILPLLTNPKVADEANRDGFTYVTTRMEYYAALEPLLLRLGSNFETSPALTTEINNHIIQLYRFVLEFQLKSVLRFYKSRPRRYAGDAVQREDWGKMLCNIKEFENTVDRTLMQINQFAVRRELEFFSVKSTKTLETMRQFLSVSEDQVRIATEQLEIAQRSLQIQEDGVKQTLSDRENECLQLFRLTDSSKDTTYEWYKDRVEPRVDGTCEWFLKHENFQRWLKQESGPLLVSADPGCGKSVLAKYLIDSRLPRSSTICYFFFKDQDQNTSRQALCALLHQLLSSRPYLIEHAMKQFDTNGLGLVNSTSSLWTILRNTVQDPRAGPIIIVLDALDECAELELQNLIKTIEQQFRSSQSNSSKVKYLLTSRPYEQIMSKFRYFLDKFPYVRIPGEEESEIISQEVNQVIKYRVENLARGKKLSDHVKGHLEERLLKIPHRTYLWVYLVFDYLEKEDFKKTPKGVDATVATLPRSVYEAYEKILSKSKGDGTIVRKALSIIIAASRPLTVREMNIALDVNDTSKSFRDLDLEEEEDFKSRLRSWCGLFVAIHQGKIYFLHQTAREFLMSKSSTAVSLEGHWQNSITSRHAHRVLAETCMTFLDLDSSEILPQDLLKGKWYRIYWTFFEYSAKNWNAHFLEAGFSDDASIIPLALRLSDPELRNSEMWFRHGWDNGWKHIPKLLTSLLVSSFSGNHVLVKLLLEKSAAELEVADEIYGQTPLLWAVKKGHNAVVRVLLENNANTGVRDDSYGSTPLSCACRLGHETIVELLLAKQSVDIDFTDSYSGQTALSWAAAGGHAGIVKLLLDRGADIDHKSEPRSRTPLLIAAEQGYGKVVQLLIERGADLECEMNDGGTTLTALSLAAREGRPEVVELLLEAGANVEHKRAKRCYTPLYWAAKRGYTSIVKMLLDKGADMEPRDATFDRTPLLWAASKGHRETVKHLLEYGADVEFQSTFDGNNALSLAVKQGYTKTAELLLERGAKYPMPLEAPPTI